MEAIRFSIPGPPVGKGRPKFSTAGKFPRAYTPEKTAAFENLVKLSYTAIGAGMLEGPLAVSIKLYFQIPESRSKKDQALMEYGDIFPEVKPDLDNCAKAVLDALNGVAFPDDKNVVRLSVSKRYGKNPRTDVRITPVRKRSEIEAEKAAREDAEDAKQSGDHAC